MVNEIRHVTLYDAHKVRNVPHHVIGSGAVGSKIVLSLARMNVPNIKVYDFDTVGDHNLANQAFLLEHLNMPKVDAIKDLVKKATGNDIETFIRITENEALGLHGLMMSSDPGFLLLKPNSLKVITLIQQFGKKRAFSLPLQLMPVPISI